MPDMSDIVDIEDIIIAPAGSLENAEISDARSEKTPDPVPKVIGDEENEGTDYIMFPADSSWRGSPQRMFIAMEKREKVTSAS